MEALTRDVTTSKVVAFCGNFQLGQNKLKVVFRLVNFAGQGFGVWPGAFMVRTAVVRLVSVVVISYWRPVSPTLFVWSGRR